MSSGYESYIGIWQYREEIIKENSTKIDNLLLVINSDGTSVYRKCRFDESRTQNTTRRSSKSVSLPSSFVVEISGDQITLLQEVGWFSFKKEIDVDRTPYLENGTWYIGIEEKTLALLNQEQVDTETNWSCPDDEET